MTNVIKALEHCKDNQYVNDCNECDYGGKTGMFCIRMIDDVIAQLNNQQKQIEELEERLAIVLEGQPEIVRCKYCEHATMTSDGKMCKYCEMDTDDFGDQRDVYHDADWFCADGKRKGSE